MTAISHLKSRQVFDSRGFPTIETDVFLTAQDDNNEVEFTHTLTRRN